jgi:hypothetical protein
MCEKNIEMKKGGLLMRTRLETSIPASVASDLQALKEMSALGFLRSLINHGSCAEELNPAVSIVAYNPPFNVVVDTELRIHKCQQTNGSIVV